MVVIHLVSTTSYVRSIGWACPLGCLGMRGTRITSEAPALRDFKSRSKGRGRVRQDRQPHAGIQRQPPRRVPETASPLIGLQSLVLRGRHAASILVEHVEKPTDKRASPSLCCRVADADSLRSDRPSLAPAHFPQPSPRWGPRLLRRNSPVPC